jgi:hypothetical protein
MPSKNRWSADVTQHSDALDLEGGVFTHDDPKQLAQSLKHSAEESHRRKSDPYRSAMSMLTFYINRAGKICRRNGCKRSTRRKTSCASSSAAKRAAPGAKARSATSSARMRTRTMQRS